MLDGIGDAAADVFIMRATGVPYRRSLLIMRLNIASHHCLPCLVPCSRLRFTKHRRRQATRRRATLPARALTTLVGAATVSSTMLLNSPQPGHLPIGRGAVLPQFWQTYCVRILLMIVGL